MASANVLEFSTENWQTEVVQSAIPVVVDFWAPWCGPCRQLTPTIEKLATQYAGRIKVGKVNVDDNNDLAIQYGIMNIPRILIFKGNDQPKKTIVGAAHESVLAKEIDSVLAG